MKQQPADGLKSAQADHPYRCFEVIFHENENNEFWPRSWTFSYPNGDCADFFGNIKTGAVHVILSDFWKNEGSLRTIRFEDFTINGNSLEGTRSILNTGFNDQENLTFERSCADASYSRGDTATITFESQRSVEMIAGYETFLAADDEYMVGGGASGVNYDGKSFTISITDELCYKKCSMFPVSGSVAVEVDGNQEMVIEYGVGECDNLALMITGTDTTEITLGHPNQHCRAE